MVFWGLFISSWLGSKALFLITSASADLSLIQSFSFWTGGGFVFYGGLIAALLYILSLRFFNISLTEKTIWSLLLALSVGHAIGRFGCFLAGCCYGAETDWTWGVWLHGEHRHPTQLIEAVGLIMLAWILKAKGPGTKSFVLYFIFYGVLRLWVELLRGDQIRGQWWIFTPSQWISIALIFIGLGLLTVSKLKLFKQK
jgi:phosphatidylglycerol:prolipoprotein diacylglycerol transferase